QQAEGGELGVGRPHLLAVEQEPAVVLAGTRLDPGEVRPGGGLGEELTPDLVAVEHRPEVAALLLVGAVGDDRRPEHPDADHVEDPRHAGAADLLVDRHLLDRPQALAAELLRPGDAGQAGLCELALPLAPRLDVGVLVAGRRARRRLGFVLLEPGPDLGPERGLLWRVVEVHALGPPWLAGQSVSAVKTKQREMIDSII